MKRYIEVDGVPQPIDDLTEWARQFESADKNVARNKFGDVVVSTVFLGLDHGWDSDSDPILYETMIFGGEHDGYQERYTSRVDALAGHQRALLIVQQSLT